MSAPVPSDGGISLWQVGTSIASGIGAALATVGALVNWLLRRIDAVRAENEASVYKLRSEVLNQIDAHRREYREDRQEAQRWREGVLSSMVTRAEMDRIIDRQTDDLLERLDARVKPLLDREREARR